MRGTIKEENGMYSLKDGVECNVFKLIQRLGIAEDRVKRLEREINVLGNRKNEIHFAEELIAEEKPTINIENMTINITTDEPHETKVFLKTMSEAEHQAIHNQGGRLHDHC